MPRGNEARALQLLNQGSRAWELQLRKPSRPRAWELQLRKPSRPRAWAATRDATAMSSSSPHSPQLEKAREQQRDPAQLKINI